jgi:hypothetical protein
MWPSNNSVEQSFFKNLRRVVTPTIELQPCNDNQNNSNWIHQVGVKAPTNNATNVTPGGMKLYPLESIQFFLACIHKKQEQMLLIF